MALRPPSLFLLPLELTETSEPDSSPTDTVPHPGEPRHAVQNDRARTDSATAGTARAVAGKPDVAFDDGRLRPGAESQPRGMDGALEPQEARQRPPPAFERSPGDRPQGNGGGFVLRLENGRG